MFPKPFRLWQLIAISLVLLVVVALIAPHQVPLMLYKLCLVTLAGFVGYWLDRLLFPYARPHRLMPSSGVHGAWHVLVSACMVRRALIVGAAMLAVAMGL
ncbi:putative holin [Abyssibacter profundi]|uniref:Holin n=1 Tax=Abyssibacter profundi TaxID=2182787 RepID=A0A363ULC1_9GAMM|nr:putative holin [Abyssibacter profundi]PWN56203.1 hypothetical protein DEH80_07985 [Abyssibacter profundi]